MARLPQPGGDSGNWGSILNDYLVQSHKADGTLKDEAIGSAQLQDSSVTTRSIVDESVTNVKIAPDTISKNQLEPALRSELDSKIAKDVADNSYLVKPKLFGSSDQFGFSRTNPGNVISVGFDSNAGRMYYSNSNNLFWSDDYGATISSAKSLPPGVTAGASVAKILRFGNFLWCVAPDAGDNNRHKVYRSSLPVGTANFAWSGALFTLTTGSTGFSTAVACDTQNMYVGEYADPSGQRPKAYKLTLSEANGTGTDWTVMWQPTFNTRHIHTIAPDPYRPGHVWIAGGDGSGFSIVRTEDYGVTWITVATDPQYQVVQISFSDKWIFTACDTARCTVLVWDRTTYTPRSAAMNWHGHTPVPGGASRRVVSDAVTNGTTTLTSASANFTADDKGRMIGGPGSSSLIGTGAYIASVTNSTTVVMNQVATAGSGLSLNIDGDRFYKSAFYGAVDPATGIYYAVANDPSGGGTRFGLFALMDVGMQFALLDDRMVGGLELFIAGGRLHTHRYNRTLLAPI